MKRTKARRKLMKQILATNFFITLACIALAACSPKPEARLSASGPTPEPAAAAPVAADVPAGAYTLDKSHATLIFRVNHLGFSNYTARFKRFDAKLQFDPAHLASSSVTATVDARSLETDFPDPATLDFNAELQNEQWLNTAQFPEMTFRSTTVELTGPNTVRINGDFSLHGVTRPLALDATFNGGYAGHPMDPHARIGFSAHGSLKRSEFGIAYGIPAPGTTMGVSDNVDVIIEAEFSGPPLATTPNDHPG
jgi:polyisoprenoid-binding protein YceI